MCGKIKEWFHDQKMTIKAELKSVTIRAAFIGAGLSFLISIISIAVASCISLDANNIARNAQKYVEKEFAIQFTSNLGAYIDHRNFYVGDGKPFQRIDNFIQIPLVIYNKNYGLATDIELTLIFNDGDRDLGPINEIIPFLKGADIYKITFVQPILNNSKKLYFSGDKEFKMKLFLEWNDANASAGRHRSVELFKLVKTQAYVDWPSKFILVPQESYNDYYNKDGFNKHSQKKIDF